MRDAEVWLEKHGPGPVPVNQLRKARALVGLGRLAEAQKSAELCEELNRRDVPLKEQFTKGECRVELGWALLGLADANGALDAFSRAADAAGALGSQAAAIDAALGMGWTLLATGDLSGASAKFDDAAARGTPERIA